MIGILNAILGGSLFNKVQVAACEAQQQAMNRANYIGRPGQVIVFENLNVDSIIDLSPSDCRDATNDVEREDRLLEEGPI